MSSSSLLHNGILPKEAEDIIRGLPKFPGAKVNEYSKLAGFKGCHNIIIWNPCNPVILPNLPINGTEFAVILVTDGLSLKRVSVSELKEMRYGLSPYLAEAVDAGWHYADALELKAKNLALESVPPLSLNWIEADGSIAVSSATGVNWIVVGAHNQLATNFELFKELTPEIACQMPACEILNATSGVTWTVNDAARLLSSFSKGCNLPLPSTNRTIGGTVPFPVNNGQDCFLAIGAPGTDEFKKNNSDNYYARFLSSPFGKVREIFLTAGMNMDSQIGAAIIGVGVASPPASLPNDNGNRITPFECFRLASYASSCLLIFTSWMLNPTSKKNPVKEQRLKSLSQLTAGGAMISLFAGVFCNIFAPLPLPYAVCAVIICVFVLLGAAGYNAFSK